LEVAIYAVYSSSSLYFETLKYDESTGEWKEIKSWTQGNGDVYHWFNAEVEESGVAELALPPG